MVPEPCPPRRRPRNRGRLTAPHRQARAPHRARPTHGRKHHVRPKYRTAAAATALDHRTPGHRSRSHQQRAGGNRGESRREARAEHRVPSRQGVPPAIPSAPAKSRVGGCDLPPSARRPHALRRLLRIQRATHAGRGRRSASGAQGAGRRRSGLRQELILQPGIRRKPTSVSTICPLESARICATVRAYQNSCLSRTHVGSSPAADLFFTRGI